MPVSRLIRLAAGPLIQPPPATSCTASSSTTRFTALKSRLTQYSFDGTAGAPCMGLMLSCYRLVASLLAPPCLTPLPCMLTSLASPTAAAVTARLRPHVPPSHPPVARAALPQIVLQPWLRLKPTTSPAHRLPLLRKLRCHLRRPLLPLKRARLGCASSVGVLRRRTVLLA